MIDSDRIKKLREVCQRIENLQALIKVLKESLKSLELERDALRDRQMSFFDN